MFFFFFRVLRKEMILGGYQDKLKNSYNFFVEEKNIENFQNVDSTVNSLSSMLANSQQFQKLAYCCKKFDSQKIKHLLFFCSSLVMNIYVSAISSNFCIFCIYLNIYTYIYLNIFFIFVVEMGKWHYHKDYFLFVLYCNHSTSSEL